MVSDIAFLYILVCIYVYLCYYNITNIADCSSSIQHVEPSDSVSEPLTKVKTCHTCGKRKQTKGNQLHVPNCLSNAWVIFNGSFLKPPVKNKFVSPQTWVYFGKYNRLIIGGLGILFKNNIKTTCFAHHFVSYSQCDKDNLEKILFHKKFFTEMNWFDLIGLFE